LLQVVPAIAKFRTLRLITEGNLNGNHHECRMLLVK